MLVAVPALHAHYLTWLLVPILGIWVPWLLHWDRRAETVSTGTEIGLQNQRTDTG
jgi:hypothetical protein